MTLKDTLQETYTALSANKVRSGLTMLGIVIGIGSVIAMVSVGQGSTASIQSSIQSLGSNLIEVTPGASRSQGFGPSSGRGNAKTLTNDDASAIASEVSNIKEMAWIVSGRYQVTAKGTNTNTSVYGITSSYADIKSLSIDEGTFITDTQNESLAKVAVLGPTTMQDLFGTDTATSTVVGKTVRINSMEFKVVGVTVAKGGSGFANQDDRIYIPVMTAERYLTGGKYLTELDVEAASADSMTQVQDDITTLLLSRHNISDSSSADFSTLNQNDLVSTVSSVSNTMTLLLASIAGISLVVGGIGIMNMMLTTVTERTREIGLRKAIGARRRDISKQFLIEAVMLTLVGGIIGIIVGCSVSWIVNWTGVLTTSISLYSIVLSFGVSAAIGILFGYYPARRAAGLNPIDALRYE